MSFRQISVSGFPAVALRSALVEVVAVPAIGMKLTNLRRLNGREWLWRSDQIPLAPPSPGASYVETADSGGWDECFPTVGPSPVPGAAPGTPLLPDHGELWAASWTSSVFDGPDGTTLAGSAQGTSFPYEFHRRVTLDPVEPRVRFDYWLRHTGEASFPWIWSCHPLLNVQPGSVLALPDVAQVKVAAVHGRTDWQESEVINWPEALDGGGDGFTFPEGGGWAAKLFGDIGSRGRMTLTDPRRGERLEFSVNPGKVPQVGVWINCRGWAPRGRTPYYNLALEPCIGAPDRLDIAALDWQTAQTLEPGEERRWSVDVWLGDETD
jgi:galactose mutarotase-like enzyme